MNKNNEALSELQQFNGDPVVFSDPIDIKSINIGEYTIPVGDYLCGLVVEERWNMFAERTKYHTIKIYESSNMKLIAVHVNNMNEIQHLKNKIDVDILRLKHDDGRESVIKDKRITFNL